MTTSMSFKKSTVLCLCILIIFYVQLGFITHPAHTEFYISSFIPQTACDYIIAARIIIAVEMKIPAITAPMAGFFSLISSAKLYGVIKSKNL